jgi:hypothetical protein
MVKKIIKNFYESFLDTWKSFLVSMTFVVYLDHLHISVRNFWALFIILIVYGIACEREERASQKEAL